MEFLIKGALAGLGLGIALMVIDYSMSKKNAAERAARIKGKPALDAAEIKSLKSLFRFCLILPFAFAVGAWMIWG